MVIRQYTGLDGDHFRFWISVDHNPKTMLISLALPFNLELRSVIVTGTPISYSNITATAQKDIVSQ